MCSSAGAADAFVAATRHTSSVGLALAYSTVTSQNAPAAQRSAPIASTSSNSRSVRERRADSATSAAYGYSSMG